MGVHKSRATLVLFLVLFSYFIQLTHCEGDGDDEYKDSNLSTHSIQIRTTVICLITLLVILSVMFDLFKEQVERTTSEQMHPIINQLWEELTVLGFLSVLSFFLSKVVEYYEYPLGDLLFGESDADLIVDLLEDIHMMLFAVMIVFIAEVLLLIRLGERTKNTWQRYEYAATHRANKVLKTHADTSQNCLYKCVEQVLPFLGTRSSQKIVYYTAIRHEFISPRDSAHTCLPPDFDFAEYLSLILGDLLRDLVEISPKTWVALEVFFILGYLFSYLPDIAFLIGYIAFGWILVFIMAMLGIYLNRIFLKLIPKIDASTDIHEETGLFVNMQVPAFLRQGGTIRKYKGKVSRLIFGPPANAHQSLFIGYRRGKKIIIGCIRFVLLLCSIYVSALVAIAVLAPKWWVALICIPIVLLPIAIVGLFYAPKVIRTCVIVCNIEMMKRPEIISQVLRAQQTKKAFQVLKVIQTMKFRCLRINANKSGSQLKVPKTLLPERKKFLQEIFDLFDADKSGSISPAELVSVFEMLGQNISLEQAQAIVTEVSSSVEGELTFEEFCEFMNFEMHSSDIPVDELVESMFEVLDIDNSGSISRDEFAETISKLGVTFSESDIRVIIDEIDIDGDGQISLPEFRKFVEKHLKAEKKRLRAQSNFMGTLSTSINNSAV